MTATTAAARPIITITDRDLARLDRAVSRALDGRHAAEAEALDLELSRARIVPAADVPRDVVTMGSTVVVEDQAAATRRTFELVFPEDADAASGRISVLAPIGAAVIGLHVGAEIEWHLPNGRATKLRVVEIVRQGEGAGAR